MARVPKPFRPLDRAVARILLSAVEREGVSLRTLAERTDMSVNRLGIILREESPPASLGEIAMIAYAVGMSAREVVRLAEEAIATPSATSADAASSETGPVPRSAEGIESTRGPKIATPPAHPQKRRRTGNHLHGHTQ